MEKKKKDQSIKKSNKKKVNEPIQIDSQLEVKSCFKKIYLGYYPRYIIYLTCVVISLVFFLIFACNGIEFKEKVKLHYKIKPSIDYKVYLKENEYYKEKYLSENMQYISGLIDYIDLNLKYKVDISEKANCEYKYNIKADLIITDKNNSDKVLYKSSEILKDIVVVKNPKTNNINVIENIKLNYDNYDGLVSSFKGKYNISVSSNLIITMHVDTIVQGEKINKDIIDSEDMVVTIPLSEQTINILTDYKKDGKDETISRRFYLKIINQDMAISSLIFGIISAISIRTLFIFIKKTSKAKSCYAKRLDQILSDYDQLIVSIGKMPVLNDCRIIEVESFEELLDASKNLNKPILYIEIHKHQKSYFLILEDNNVYRYVLKEVDLTKNS